jgi:hypothetical protein
MNKKQEFGKKLTQSEVEAEISKIKDFFDQIPDELKAVAAEHFIYEIVNCGSRDHYQALGIFQEAMNDYREVSLRVLAEEAEEEMLEAAYENVLSYRCVKEMDFGEGEGVAIGEVCKIGFVEDDDRYSGGKRYELFRQVGQGGGHFDICQHVLDAHFELVEDKD